MPHLDDHFFPNSSPLFKLQSTLPLMSFLSSGYKLSTFPQAASPLFIKVINSYSSSPSLCPTYFATPIKYHDLSSLPSFFWFLSEEGGFWCYEWQESNEDILCVVAIFPWKI